MLLLVAPLGVRAQAVGDKFKSGTLYYEITKTDPPEVAVAPQIVVYPYWNSGNKPTGAVDIPATVKIYGAAYAVTSIAEGTFYGCEGLTSVEIPSSVTSIGDWAFWGCKGLESFEVVSGNQHFSSQDGVLFSSDKTTLIQCPYGKAGEYSIPESVTSIAERAFGGCEGLTKVTIPSSVSSIGEGAFWGCKGLTAVTIPNSVTSIENAMFYKCSGLTSVTIPNSVTSIGQSAFSNCESLTSVTIPGSVTSIGEKAFLGCESLTSVTILNSVTTIGEGAFYGCSGLSKIDIPNSVTSIGKLAFANCGRLSVVTIPSSVTSIGNSAFSQCTKLAAVISYIEDVRKVRLESDVFEGVPVATCKLYVPEGKESEYGAADQWKEFKNILAINPPTPPPTPNTPTPPVPGTSATPPTAVAPAPEPLAIHPNPTAGAIYLEAQGEVRVFNSLGRLVHAVKADGPTRVDLGHLPAGLYVVRTGAKVAKVVKR